MSSLLRVITGPYTFTVLLLSDRECLLGTPTLPHRPAAPELGPMYSPSSQHGNPLGWKHQWGVRSLQVGAHWMWVGTPPWWRLTLGQGQPEYCHLLTGLLEGFSITEASLIRWEPITNYPLCFNSFHHWQWLNLSISTWIHLWGWVTRSGSFNFDWGRDQDWLAEAWARVLGLDPPVWVG